MLLLNTVFSYNSTNINHKEYKRTFIDFDIISWNIRNIFFSYFSLWGTSALWKDAYWLNLKTVQQKL
jgi:hypothetical protein